MTDLANIALETAQDMLTTPGSEGIMIQETTRGYGVNVDTKHRFTFTRQMTTQEILAVVNPDDINPEVIFDTDNRDQAIGFLAGLFIVEAE